MKETFPPRPRESHPFTGIAKELLEWFEDLAAHPHVRAVMHIPADEPIFILRAQDKFILDVITVWQIMAVNKPGSMNLAVSQEKFDRVSKHLQEITDWQRANPDKVKIPD